MNEYIIKGQELERLINSDYISELDTYMEYDKEGICGFFINNECVYIFGGRKLFDRLYLELNNLKELKTDTTMKYELMRPHILLLEWRILEFTINNIENKDKWITYYHNPIFNLSTRKGGYHALSQNDFDSFIMGVSSMCNLKTIIDTTTPIIVNTEKNDPLHKKKPFQGVYMIRNIYDDIKYIGSSTDIKNRWQEHIRDLKNNVHHSYKLQQAYNITKDINMFEFSIIEKVSTKKKLYDREQYWTDYYDAYKNGYNCTQLSDGTDKHPNNQSKIHNENETDKFKSLYNTYKNSIIMNESTVRRISDNDWTQRSVVRINKVIEWYINYFNTDNTVASLLPKLNEIHNKYDWILSVRERNSDILICEHWALDIVKE